MKTTPKVPSPDTSAILAIYRRDLDCVNDRQGVTRMTPVERDRHVLIEHLRMLTAQIQEADRRRGIAEQQLRRDRAVMRQVAGS